MREVPLVRKHGRTYLDSSKVTITRSDPYVLFRLSPVWHGHTVEGFWRLLKAWLVVKIQKLGFEDEDPGRKSIVGMEYGHQFRYNDLIAADQLHLIGR